MKNVRLLGLTFFLWKGFHITGTAKDHYKQGIDEHMLYKEPGDEPWREIVPQVNSQDEAVHLLREIYPAPKERLGVHVIEVEKQ